MRLTEREIEEMCLRPSAFAAGRQYLENNRIKKIEKCRVNSAETYISAKVKGSHMYNVTVWIDDGRISHKLCDCAAFHKYPGICKHIAAVLLSYAERNPETGGDVAVSTSPEVNRIIRIYKSRESAAAVNMPEGDKVIIVPHISFEKVSAVKADFRVGTHRKYVIKDIKGFADRLDNCEYFSYGKNFGFLHSENVFDEKSKRLARFIKNSVSENEIFNKSYNKYAYLAELSVRELTLTPAAVDELMEICTGSEIDVTLPYGDDAHMAVENENPSLKIGIEKYGEGARLTVGKMAVFEGRKHCYVCLNGKIHRCSEKYTQAMCAFLKVASLSGGGTFTVGRGDMMSLCSSVLPVISEFSDVQTNGIDLDKYAMPDAVVKFFVDNPRHNTVVCRAECTYGEVRVDLFDEPAGKSTFRNLGMEANIKMCLMRYFKYNDSGLMEIRDDEEALFRLADTGFDEMKQFGEVYISEQFERLRIAPVPKISVGVSLSGGLLDFEFNSAEISPRELSKILKSYKMRRKYHRLPDGAFLKLENNAIASVAEAISEATDGGEIDSNVIKMPKYRALYIDSVLKGDIDVRRNADFKAMIRNIKSVEDSDFEIPGTLREVLRGFQKTGFRWLKTINSYGLCGILADEMGLGKTLQIISLFLSEKEEKGAEISLIVCPASLVYNWESEICRFAPELRACVITGSLDERSKLIKMYGEYDVFITSYDLLKRDMDLYSDIEFRFEVIDEAQYIKNYFTQSAKAVKAIRSKSRFALTGTPIENRLSELWSIFDYLMPGFLYTYKRFREEFELPIVRDGDAEALGRMRRMIAPFVLRRLKADVLCELPEKLDNVVISKMDPEQEKLYAATVSELKASLENSSSSALGSDAIRVLAALTRLRQICCDPSLIYENYSGGSAKLETCLDIVRETIESGHKVLIFSQFTSMLEIFERRLLAEGIDFFTLTGTTGKEKRMSLVNSFQTGKTPVFLISLKAGGTGLNLTAADVVIHYDPWWNTAAQEQATDRAHRIGQKHVVMVYKFIAKGTIEENILNLQENKKKLAESIIGESALQTEKLTKEDVLAILEGRD